MNFGYYLLCIKNIYLAPERDQSLTTDQLQAQHHLTAAAQVTAGHLADQEEWEEAGVEVKLQNHKTYKAFVLEFNHNC